MSGEWNEHELKPGGQNLFIDAYAHWYDFPDAGGERVEEGDGSALIRLELTEPNPSDKIINEISAALGGVPLDFLFGNTRSGVFFLNPDSIPDVQRLIDALESAQARLVQSTSKIQGTFVKPDAAPSGDSLSKGLPPANSVITAIIDDGIGFAHERFRKAVDSTRIEYFWDQNPHYPVPGPEGFGREWTKADIDKLLDSHCHGGLVDEEALYRAAGIVDYRRRIENPNALGWSHGTHVLDTAAGAEVGQSSRNPIIAVQLPSRIVALTNGLYTEWFAQAAMQWIIDRARELAVRMNCDPLPVVINFSFGDFAGRHDNLGSFETFMDDILEDDTNPVKAICLPAGNSFLLRAHAEVPTNDVLGKGTPELHMRVQPGNKAPTFVQIWLPILQDTSAGSGPDRLDVQLVPPVGEPSPEKHEIGPESFWEYTENGKVIARIYRQIDGRPTAPANGADRLKITIAIQPTEVEGADQSFAPSGIWKIRLFPAPGLETDATVDIWIERGDTPGGYRAQGRQSYFEDQVYRRYIGTDTAEGRPVGDPEERDQAGTNILRTGTLSPVASGLKTIGVGAFRKDTHDAAFYSSSGPHESIPTIGQSPNTQCEGPDLATVAEDSRIRDNRLASGTYSGSIRAMRGTSVAAPLAARKAVGILLADQSASLRDRIRTQAQHYEACLPPDAPPENSNRVGKGRLNVPFDRTVPRRET